MSRRIEIVPYDSAWPERFEAERGRLVEIFGELVRSVHHVGSTSVPGLEAKPVIDILIVVSDDCGLSAYDAGMIALGYTPRGECLDAGGTPGRFYYSRTVGRVRTHQVHVCREGHFEIREMLAFPRYLREHREAAEEYARLKHRLAREHRCDIAAYIEGKDAFVRERTRRGLELYGTPLAGTGIH